MLRISACHLENRETGYCPKSANAKPVYDLKLVMCLILICFPYALSRALTKMSRFILGRLEVAVLVVLSFSPTAATTNPDKP
jgi:hypothetical protein